MSIESRPMYVLQLHEVESCCVCPYRTWSGDYKQKCSISGVLFEKTQFSVPESCPLREQRLEHKAIDLLTKAEIEEAAVIIDQLLQRTT